jgi:uncharacterized protein
MSVALLDVNVLVALSWPGHTGHQAALGWFSRHGRQGWASCPMTQTGLVRILSSSSFSADAYTPTAALRILQANLEHPEHHFWPDDLGLLDAVAQVQLPIQGHKQVTDAYLLGLALHRKGRFVTADRSVRALLPKGAPANALVVI